MRRKRQVQQGIERFLDEEGKLKLWPAKKTVQDQVYAYLAQKFSPGKDYSEHEVNAVLASWHTFGDLFLLRRGLIESGWLIRLRDGSRYWRNPEKKEERE
ncbi:MAG: DUF2087 domain-containing protein [Christensenella sp.]